MPRIFLLSLLLVVAIIPLVAARESFEQCGARIQSYMVDQFNHTIFNESVTPYLWTGTVHGLLSGAKLPLLVTNEGCKRLCGSRPHYYSWERVSDTITTWVLPLAGGLVLQLPFESNNATATLLALCRWLGNPVMVITAILWNIKTTGRCALLLDRSVGREELIQFGSRPNGWFVNKIKQLWEQFRGVDEEELPVELPRSDLQLDHDFAEFRDSLYILSVLNQYSFRHDNARTMLTNLKLALFCGDHDIIRRRRSLAIALRRDRRHGVVQVLVSLLWFLVALGISIYKAFGDLGDNTTAHNLALGLLMSWLPVLVTSMIVDRNPANSTETKGMLNQFLIGVRPPPPVPSRSDYLLPATESATGGYLLFFCGQARRKWHYGVAHSVLRTLESHGLKTRGFLSLYSSGVFAAQDSSGDLWRFDMKEIWQMFVAGWVVAGSALGAFAVSYHTPTVGLGCRSGGYMIYSVVTASAFFLEILGWTMHKNGQRRKGSFCHFAVPLLSVFITLLEIANTAWLVYIILAQTIGIYNTCDCNSSMWGSIGGYVDFASPMVYITEYGVRTWWIIGLGVGASPLLVIVYVVYQWCTQSFLWAQSFENAMRGLARVRKWKSCVPF